MTRRSSTPNRVEGSILQTLAYSAHFGSPLTHTELRARLIHTPLSSRELSRHLPILLTQKLIEHTGNYYYLPGHRLLLARRLRRLRLSAPLQVRARSLASQLARLPGVLAIYLTGSLAMSNAHRDADIDFMIITHSHRLWLTRLILTLYCELFGLRRHAPAKLIQAKRGLPHKQNIAGKLCLNLYLSPISYTLPTHKRSLYTAYELIQAVPLYDPYDTRSALLVANSWIKNYLPNVILGSDLTGSTQPYRYNERGRSDPKGLLEFIEFLCYRLQLSYMRPRLTREYITPDSAFFHPVDPGQPILRKLSLLK